MTDVVFALRFASSSPLHGPILETFFGEVAQRQIGAFQQRCGRVWGRGARRHVLPTPLTGNSKV
jgi:ribosome-associated toxin RatA of RatAB toxin-antitoxin module